MAKKHLKTLTAPVSWPIKRKGQTFVIRPLPGKPFEMSIPLALILKDMLGYCKTSKEVRALLNDKEIFVDGKRRKEEKFLVGVMDVLSIPLTKENYRMIINKHGKLELFKIDEAAAGKKILKIIGKSTLKKGTMQLNLSDGRNIIVKEDKCKIGDSVHMKVPSQEIIDYLKLEKGSFVYITKGGHTGFYGVVEEINGDFLKVKSEDISFITPKNTVFVVTMNKPLKKTDE